MAAKDTAQRVKPPNNPNQYTVGLICGRTHEATAVTATFDHAFRPREIGFETPGDKNFYTFGTIGKFHVVLAILAKPGAPEAAVVAAHMKHSFRNMELCLVVGTCAIIPSLPGSKSRRELTLGDIAISTVVRNYAKGKEYPTGFHPTEMSGSGPADLVRLLNGLSTPLHIDWFQEDMLQILEELDDHSYMEDFTYPGFEIDHLYETDYIHEHCDNKCSDCSSKGYCQRSVAMDCKKINCSGNKLVVRKRIQELKKLGLTVEDQAPWAVWTAVYKEKIYPKIVFGPVATVEDNFIMNSELRDRLSDEYGIIALETEGAGVWDNIPTVVIKAGSDYGDNHKNEIWQNWAARTAAACAKAFLMRVQLGMEGNIETEDESASENERAVGRGPRHRVREHGTPRMPRAVR